MRYAIFSDVHANLRAWEQVLADIRGQNADVLICLGDAVGYGPKPEEVLQGIRAVTDNFVMGNHDAAAAGAMDYSAFNEHARNSIEWTANSLSDESRQYLGSVPLGIDDGEILFVHAEISEPGRFGYIDDLESAKENFASSEHFLTFVGHTHKPNIFQVGADGQVTEFTDENQQLNRSNRYIVNVGSVGEPRVPDDLRGVYVIYDSETRELFFRRVGFDIEAYRKDLESTTLGLKPFFLQCYEHQNDGSKTTLLDAAQALAMEAPAVSTAISSQRGSVKLHIPSAGERLNYRGPLEVETVENKKSKAGTVVVFALAGLVMIALGIWSVFHFRGEPETEVVTIGEENSTLLPIDDLRPEEPEEEIPATEPPVNPEPLPEPIVAVAPTPLPEQETIPDVEPETIKPKAQPEPDPLVSWWRMDSDSLDGDLVDQAGNHSLTVQLPGSKIGELAPSVIPANGIGNDTAMGLGVWGETETEGVFELTADRSFTFEGWLLTDKPRAPIFLAGTRSGEVNDSQGWHIDIRPPSDPFPDGQICFFYDNGPEIIQALSENVPVADLNPHHFAAVWDHDASNAAGEMRLYFDGAQIAATPVPHSQIASAQANPFRIGSPNNPPRIGLDEVRFSNAALTHRQFLNITPEIILLEEDFETPTVTGFKTKSAPDGWIGSVAGFKASNRGIIDQGDGSEFTTVNGRQAYILSYSNAGLTSSVSAVDEKLTAGMTYRVRFNVGTKKGTTSDYLVEFVAFEPKHDDKMRADTTSKGRPGTVLASATGIVETSDLSHTDSILFSADSTNPHLGKAIGVRMARLGHNGIPIFDNVTLTSRTEAPIPAPPGETNLTAISPLKDAGKTVAPTTAGKPTPDPVVKAPPPTAPLPQGDPTFAWWRMDNDSAGAELVDSLGKHSLPVIEAGKSITGLAPEVIPSNGIKNDAALSLGVWGAPQSGPDFELSADRSFTFEGWFLSARPRGPIFLAGTRSGESNDKQGWHVDIRSGNLMCFFYDNGPENTQALSEELPVGNLAPHHFAAVWDHDASPTAGEMRLYFDGELAAATELPHAQIPEKPANPFHIGAPTNPPRVGLDEIRFSHAALSPLEFLRAETQSMTKAGKFEDGANWSAGEPPSGTQTAVIGPGVSAALEKAPPVFAGDLVLENSAKLTIITQEGLAILPVPPSKLILHQGAELILTAGNRNANPGLSRIELAGNATIWGGRSTSGHHAQRLFAEEISGKGALILDGVNNNQFCLAVANSFQGGLVAQATQNQGFHVRAQAAGSLSTGNVTIKANASLKLEAEDAISPTASLILEGVKDGRSPSKVILNANNTVTSLVIDGTPQKAGTWGAPGSGADNEHATFSGAGLLTARQ